LHDKIYRKNLFNLFEHAVNKAKDNLLIHAFKESFHENVKKSIILVSNLSYDNEKTDLSLGNMKQ